MCAAAGSQPKYTVLASAPARGHPAHLQAFGGRQSLRSIARYSSTSSGSRSRRHRTVRFDTRGDAVDIIGVGIGRMRAGAA